LAGERARRTSRISPPLKIAALTASWGCDGWTGGDGIDGAGINAS
jgi:hypothetical protein